MKAENSARPLLIGLLVDVSGSMVNKLQNQRGQTRQRLERVQESLDDLVIRARSWRDENERQYVRRFAVFVHGFGLGNLRDLVLARKIPSVANLLSENPNDERVVSSDALLDDWSTFRDRIRSYTPSMLGATPMKAALERAARVMAEQLRTGEFEADPLLLVLSDGVPTDDLPGSPDVLARCGALKQAGVTILSCYLSEEDVTVPRVLYDQPIEEWSEGARLMFECASVLPKNSVLWPHLHEHNWAAPPGARLFAQVNQSEILTEFIETLLGPIEQEKELMRHDRKQPLIFVSYSHADRKYVEDKAGSLLYYLRGLEHENVDLWWDEGIPTGASWDASIREKLEQATVALVLVSQAFLTSRYCTDVEIESFLRRRKDGGLIVIPVILSACDWGSHSWLSETQALPREGRTIESNYRDAGRRKELYLEVLRAIRAAL